ncbi:thioredoxin domain-containing protein [Parvibaculaceae bacterium PLY_AMNH_Bact1]|nr:thioredoxin domain-containing protein [Parvibaculaceae bacterium PLY_AMNH_Bact1]
MNQLSAETSPYLLQHQDNPVHWHPWGPDALALARAENKPILLSVGYAACHWCHVMAHESFENPATAEIMNRLYINIKVDREERPDIDTIYMSALHALGEQGGWPLTMFLTPDGEPFWGGTYFPPEPKFGRPGFPQVLEEIARLYTQEPEKIHGNRDALKNVLSRIEDTTGQPPLDMVLGVANQLMDVMDMEKGGLNGAPKFPQTGLLDVLWRAHIATGNQEHRTAVTTALTHMCEGGIYDHLGGGFARYSVDADWLVPHFEKMLYDNALLIDRLTEVWQETKDPLYAARVDETIAWIAREMTTEEGAFAASIDADSEGEEGKFYVWTADEIDTVLGTNGPWFRDQYDVRPEGNWEGNAILNRLHLIGKPLTTNDEAKLKTLRENLFDKRTTRIAPGLDDKVLLDWNGLAIAAIANASLVFRRNDWLALSQSAYRFVTESMKRHGRMHHAYRAGRLQHRAMSDGLANMGAAALALFEATMDWKYVDDAQGFITELDAHYWDETNGGYFYTADDAEALLVRTRTASDDATPAANGTLPGLLVRLYALTGDEHFRDRADQLILAFGGAVTKNAIPHGSWLASLDTAVNLTQIVIIGEAGDPARAALKETVLDMSLPTRLLLDLDAGADLPDGHPAQGKTMVDGRATAYVCTGPVCSPPVTDPADLQVALEASRLAPE